MSAATHLNIVSRCLVTAAVLLAVSTASYAFEPPKEAPRSASLTTVEEAYDTLSHKALDNIEGIWEFPADDATSGFNQPGTIVAIVASAERSHIYEIVMLQSASLYPAPGTIVGWCSGSVNPEIYKVWLYSKATSGAPEHPVEFIGALTTPLNADSYLTLEKKKRSLKINPFAIVPYMRRIFSVKSSDPADKFPNGLRRLTPSTAPRTL